MRIATRLPDVTELDWDASIAYIESVIAAANVSGRLVEKLGRELLAELQDHVFLMACCYQVVAHIESLPALPPVISAVIAPTAVELVSVFVDWAREASHEGAKAAEHGDAPAVAFAAARLRAITRAREAVERAANAGRVLATESLTGSLLVHGNGGIYIVNRWGVRVSCDCPHGQKVRTAEFDSSAKAPAGVCWHLVLREAFEEAVDRIVSNHSATIVAPLAA